MAAHLVVGNDSRTERDQLVDRRWIRIDQVDVDTILCALRFVDFVEVPGGLGSATVGPANGGELTAAALVEWSTEDFRPEASRAQDVDAVEGNVANPGCHDPNRTVAARQTIPLDPALAGIALNWYQRNVPADSRGQDGPFAPVVGVPDNADAYTRLAGYVGRPVRT